MLLFKVRNSLEALCSNLKTTNSHLEDKLGVSVVTMETVELVLNFIYLWKRKNIMKISEGYKNSPWHDSMVDFMIKWNINSYIGIVCELPKIWIYKWTAALFSIVKSCLNLYEITSACWNADYLHVEETMCHLFIYWVKLCWFGLDSLECTIHASIEFNKFCVWRILRAS